MQDIASHRSYGPILRLESVTRSFKQGTRELSVLKGASCELMPGQAVALVGPSGSGKSTMLHITGLLESPTSGRVIIGGNDCAEMSEAERTRLRRREIGFIYQFHQLLPEFSALENVAMPLLIRRLPRAEAEARAAAMLKEVGLSHRLQHTPGELSGGERQRAAVARALVTQPACVLADEPTGNLDRHTAEAVFDLMLALNASHRTSFVIVTHDPHLAAKAQRTLALDDGVLG
jgi:lipoprotein-releasing system ATP-binding protein